MSRLAWDSDFFGIEIGAVDAATEADVRPAVEAARAVDCLYVFVPAADRATIEALVRAGARLTDLRITLGRDEDDPPEPRDGTRIAGPGDSAAVERLAAALSQMSRFRADERFPAEKVAEMYRHWARRCLEDGVVVISDDGEGFVGVRDARVELVYVGAAAAGRGLGERLLANALVAAGSGRAEVVTQAQNVAALRLYERLGFRARAVAAVVHLWRDELA